MSKKLCVDCKFYKRDRGVSECLSPENFSDDYIDGKSRPRWVFVDNIRTGGWLGARFTKLCGKEGRWFQPKSADAEDAA